MGRIELLIPAFVAALMVSHCTRANTPSELALEYGLSILALSLLTLVLFWVGYLFGRSLRDRRGDRQGASGAD